MAPTIQTRLYEYERDCTRYEYACEEDIDDPWWVGVKLDMQRCSSGPLSLFKRHYVYLTYRYAYPWQLSACWWLVVESSRKKAARTHRTRENLLLYIYIYILTQEYAFPRIRYSSEIPKKNMGIGKVGNNTQIATLPPP